MGDPLRSLGALAVQGRPVPFEGFEDLIGFVIVFFAVIWPVIRGLLTAARSNRTNFEKRSQGRKGGGNSNPLEAFLDGLRDQDESDELLARQRREARAARRERQLEAERERRAQLERGGAGPRTDPFGADDDEPAASAPVPTEARMAGLEAPSPGSRPAPRPAPRPASASLPASASIRRGRPVEPVDGFEVSIDDELDQVPSEDALEAGLLPTGGPGAGASTVDGAAGREPDEEGLAVVAGAGEEAAFALPGERASALERIGGGRTPWQSAVLMKEILGPPVSLAPHDQHLR